MFVLATLACLVFVISAPQLISGQTTTPTTTPDFPVGEITLEDDGSPVPTNLNELFQKILSVSGYALGIAVLVAFVTAGFFYLTAAGTGNEEKAKKIMIYAVTGVIISTAAYLIGKTIKSLIN